MNSRIRKSFRSRARSFNRMRGYDDSPIKRTSRLHQNGETALSLTNAIYQKTETDQTLKHLSEWFIKFFYLFFVYPPEIR